MAKTLRKEQTKVLTELEVTWLLLSGDYYTDFPPHDHRPEGLIMRQWGRWHYWDNNGWHNVRMEG